MKRLTALSALMLVHAVANANPETAAEKNHPCQEIKAACKAAGFEKGKHKEGKGLHIDCLHEVMSGKTVAGVNVTPEQIKACQAKKEKRAAKKKS